MPRQAIALPDDAAMPEGARAYGRLIRRSVWLGLVGLIGAAVFTTHLRVGHSRSDLHVSPQASGTKGSLCPQADVLAPSANETLDARRHHFLTPAYRTRAIGVLSRIVQTRAESFDDEGVVGEDERWNVFDGLHERLRAEFPAIHAADSPIELQKINTYGLLYIWRGTDQQLKPVLLMAHQDTVPVDDETASSWTYPPFSGHDDGSFVWGRGACDCRSHLVSVMSAVEALVETGHRPARTIIMAFGFDEESAGTQGAGKLAASLEQQFGRDSMELIIDEGEGFVQHFGLDTAIVDTAEKGYADVSIAVRTPGGHSMAPPPHTSIGMLAAAIVELEQAAIRPNATFKPSLASGNPFLDTLRCLAEYAPTDHRHSMDDRLRRSILDARSAKDVDALAATLPTEYKWFTTTSQAVDIVRGGIKVNALPEHASAISNYRIAVHQSVGELKSDLARLLRPIAQRFDLSLDAFGDVQLAGSGGTLELKTLAELEPAPLSPTTGETWDRLAGTIRHVWQHAGRGELYVVPSLMDGNTDTASYWNLSRSIFRFSPLKASDCVNIHTIDERVGTRGHIEAILFWFELLRNFDA